MKEKEIRKREVLNRYLELLEKDANKMYADKRAFVSIACPACGSSGGKNEFEKTGFNYVLCDKCGTLFANPRPKLDALKKFYGDSESWVYFANEFYKPVLEARQEKIFRPLAQYVAANIPVPKQGTVGDIGSGYGLFLEELSRIWLDTNIIAIEPSPDMVRICEGKGLKVIPAAIEEVTGWDGKFDLLTAFELFEHLFDPAKFLEKAYDLLSQNGYLYITTLNGEGFDIQVLWEKAKSICPPLHLNFFNPASMRVLFEKKGFELVKVSTPGELDWDIVDGRFKEENVSPGRFWELVSKKGSHEAKEKLQSWIKENGFSSHMRVLARKVERK